VPQRPIHGERVVIDQRRRLVQDFMIHVLIMNATERVFSWPDARWGWRKS
jgi:hypothetical protein